MLNYTIEYSRDSVIDESYELVIEIKKNIIKNITKEDIFHNITKESINGYTYTDLVNNELTYGFIFIFQVLTLLFILYVVCIFISLPYHVYISRKRGYCI